MSLSLIFDSPLSSPRLNTKTNASISDNHLPSFLYKRNMRHHHKILLIFTTLLILTSSSIARYTLTPTTPLHGNETLISASGSFALGFFNPNPKNHYIGLWYNQIPKRKIVWVANWANPLVNSPGVLSITPNGTLTIADKNLHVVWSSNTSTKLSNPIAQLLDNGNLVVKELNDDTSNYAWQGFNNPTDTLLAGMIMGVDFATGLNRTLTSWSSPEDPTPGPYHVYIETRGDPEVFLTNDRNRIWRSGPWVGGRFSGVPNMLTYQGINFSLVSNTSGVTYSYQLEPSVISVLSLTSSGSFQRSIWVNGTQEWDDYSSAPKELCDQIGKCGNYGLCDVNESPICNCLNGFEPKNRVNWNTLDDWNDGCVRKHELECKNGVDEFRLVSNVKLPQSEDCMVDLSLNLDQCKNLCLMNCSCTAYASAVADNSSGCVIWIGVLFDLRTYNSISGQDLFVRLNAIDVPINVPINVPKGSPGSKSHDGVVVPVVVSLVAGISLMSCVGCVLHMRKRKKRKLILGAMNSYSKQFKPEHRDESIDLPMFDFDTIIAATDYFSSDNKLGEGGFGPVYKEIKQGKLGDDQEIAVKRLSKTSTQGSEEFKNEVMLIAKLQHINLVRLLGYCIQGEERVLIYEYLPNNSLDAFLFDEEKRSLLNWNTRYQIITGIARGLLYLHHDSRLRIIHRDLKAGNILLDVDMIPKISDFGMARIFSSNETDFNTRKIVGTYGYMSPEYAMDGAFSIKSDVYSFGVLVLEILSGKKNRVYAKPPHINLLAHGAGMQLVDDSMIDSYSSDEVLRCIKLGLLCVQGQPEDRPLMSSIVQMFSCDIKTIPQPKHPAFIARRYSQDSCSNEQSITMVEPR